MDISAAAISSCVYVVGGSLPGTGVRGGVELGASATVYNSHVGIWTAISPMHCPRVSSFGLVVASACQNRRVLRNYGGLALKLPKHIVARMPQGLNSTNPVAP
jgi:hypothetical protein